MSVDCDHRVQLASFLFGQSQIPAQALLRVFVENLCSLGVSDADRITKIWDNFSAEPLASLSQFFLQKMEESILQRFKPIEIDQMLQECKANGRISGVFEVRISLYQQMHFNRIIQEVHHQAMALWRGIDSSILEALSEEGCTIINH